MTLAVHAMTRLADWPDLVEAPPSCGTGHALRSAHGEIVHFHSDRRVDLHLTTGAIRRLEGHLRNETAVQLVQGSPWVTLRLEVDSDIDLLLTLVSVALHARQARSIPDAMPPDECNDHRGVR